MKAKLIFDLMDQDDGREFYFATKGRSALLLLWDMNQWIRANRKYGDKDEIDFDNLNIWLLEKLNEYDINLDRID
jgi:hypothetical protein